MSPPSADDIAAALAARAGTSRIDDTRARAYRAAFGPGPYDDEFREPSATATDPYEQRAYVYRTYVKKGRPIPNGMDLGKGPLLRDGDNSGIERAREHQAPAVGPFHYVLQGLAEEGARPSDFAAADRVKTLRRVLARIHAAKRRYHLHGLWLPFRENAKSEWRRLFGLVDEAILDVHKWQISKRFDTGAEIVIETPESPLFVWGKVIALIVAAGALCAWLAPTLFDQIMTIALVVGLGGLVLWGFAVHDSNDGGAKK